MSNNVKRDKQVAVLGALVEGCSIRSAERLTGVHRDTIMRLMVRVGTGCERVLDANLRNLTCERIQLDELHTFVGKKQRHILPTDDRSRVGDHWCFLAIDETSKLVPSYRVGKRDRANTLAFVKDLRSRLVGRVQLSSDAMEAYVEAIHTHFGAFTDYGQIVKFYESEPIGPGRYSPPKVISVEKSAVWGDPDPAHITTSHVERLNLTVRTRLRRFTRLALGFSKKPENLKAAVSLFVAHYNFVRIHRTLRVTPAMEAGVSRTLWKLGDLLDSALDAAPAN